MSTIKISVDVEEGGRPAAALIAERIHDQLNNSTAFVPGKKLHMTYSEIATPPMPIGDIKSIPPTTNQTQRITMRFAAVSLKKNIAEPVMFTRMDPISGLEEAWLHGEMIGMFGDEVSALEYLKKKLDAAPQIIISGLSIVASRSAN